MATRHDDTVDQAGGLFRGLSGTYSALKISEGRLAIPATQQDVSATAQALFDDVVACAIREKSGDHCGRCIGFGLRIYS